MLLLSFVPSRRRVGAGGGVRVSRWLLLKGLEALWGLAQSPRALTRKGASWLRGRALGLCQAVASAFWLR